MARSDGYDAREGSVTRVEATVMTVRERPVSVTAEGGKLHADLPAARIEADDAEGLMNQVDLVMQDFKASLRARIEAIEDQALRELDARALRRDELDFEKLAARYPAPPEWFDEEPE